MADNKKAPHSLEKYLLTYFFLSIFLYVTVFYHKSIAPKAPSLNRPWDINETFFVLCFCASFLYLSLGIGFFAASATYATIVNRVDSIYLITAFIAVIIIVFGGVKNQKLLKG
jgi:hypothetical protein